MPEPNIPEPVNNADKSFRRAKDKKIILGAIIALALIILASGSYIFLSQIAKETGQLKPSPQETSQPEEKSIEEKAAAGALPAINPVSNPLQDSPDINPVNRTNPFKEVKTNPFE